MQYITENDKSRFMEVDAKRWDLLQGKIQVAAE